MLSPMAKKVIKYLPEGLVICFAKKKVNGYLNKYASIHIEGFENIEKASGAKIFIGNHLSNSDGLILDRVLKEKYDPTFVAGAKLSDDPVTSLGTKIVKNITIKPNTADKEALTSMVNIVRGGKNLFLFPEGTRSRTGTMIEGKKGVLLVARLTKAPIVPIAMWGTEKLLPIAKDGEMSGEKWNKADVFVKIGEPITLLTKDKDESKQEFEERTMKHIMGSVARLLPEEYRGVYK